MEIKNLYSLTKPIPIVKIYVFPANQILKNKWFDIFLKKIKTKNKNNHTGRYACIGACTDKDPDFYKNCQTVNGPYCKKVLDRCDKECAKVPF
ncbi:hypothetical protein DDB_G0293870 [Dictyostelium discoideum AX4]|uniref:Uncharacterized protein n=1 Tax=Dictyostelium discoideum TaxID=44689 RepID=Q54B69_DICDI|nr:hypothetical protein DDB_G0293870 [Dictyostelium discoideum AX4]EAL60506.1 hypothetical protein DDB_G0293870 [Dictyostelium discoideum AX4]|eukprot:XP_628919.1 hypothetical protein DDB_G0293870 [Dictyostelium discoideum AX4]